MVGKIFFSSNLVGRIFFYSSTRIFFYYICAACNFFLPTSACRKFFFKITHPLPQELNGRPLNVSRSCSRAHNRIVLVRLEAIFFFSHFYVCSSGSTLTL